MRMAGGGRAHPPGREAGAASAGHDGWQWLYGRHAALAAASNPHRRLRRMVALSALAPALKAAGAGAGVERPAIEVVDRAVLAALLAPGAVHQGVAVLAEPLADPGLDAVIAALGADAVVVVLDQATDPRNVGAVLRSAAAFGAAAVIVQDRHAPKATGALAKAASGALESVPLVAVVNIARTVRALKDAGCFALGLDADADRALGGAPLAGRIALVIGAEGAGLRRLVREACDGLARIPIAPSAESLNVAVAAGIALYVAARDVAARDVAARDVAGRVRGVATEGAP